MIAMVAKRDRHGYNIYRKIVIHKEFCQMMHKQREKVADDGFTAFSGGTTCQRF